MLPEFVMSMNIGSWIAFFIESIWLTMKLIFGEWIDNELEFIYWIIDSKFSSSQLPNPSSINWQSGNVTSANFQRDVLKAKLRTNFWYPLLNLADISVSSSPILNIVLNSNSSLILTLNAALHSSRTELTSSSK